MLPITVFLISVLFILVIAMYIRMLYEYGRKVRVIESTSEKNNDQSTRIREYKQAPGPFPWPIIGNLSLLARHKVPFEAFTEMSKELGDIFTLTLGSRRCVVVNNLELIREVLNQNGKFFGGRPDFLRYHQLFGGDRNNSLALCDWSSLQQKRRNLARRHCSPRTTSSYFIKMSNVGSFEVSELMEKIKERVAPGEEYEIKPLIQQTCANMFIQYMCSTRFEYDDVEFQNIVTFFDEIFWEINQGYLLDFMPWLSPLYRKHTAIIVDWSSKIRKFILERIINEREQNLELDDIEKDFTDALLKSLIKDKNVSRETIIYMLEDFIGGHSAVGNLVMIALAYIAKHPYIGKCIQSEVDNVSRKGQRKISFYDIEIMPYTMATIFEVLRYASSPIVPHVATEDTVVAGYGVTKGTVLFINNYKLNTSATHWRNPELFDPTRFLEPLDNIDLKTNLCSRTTTKSTADFKTEAKRRNSEGSDSGIEYDKDTLFIISSLSECSVLRPFSKSGTLSIREPCEYGKLKKNVPHFLPFSIGKRTCIGQNLVRGFGFILLANILQQYDVSSKNVSSIKTVPACIALPTKTFPLVFTPRLTQPITADIIEY